MFLNETELDVPPYRFLLPLVALDSMAFDLATSLGRMMATMLSGIRR